MLNRNRKKHAFTFLELLVAMALMNVIAAALYASLYIGFKARESAEAAVQPIQAAWIAMEILEQDIAAALPPTGILGGVFKGVDENSGGVDCDNLVFYCSNHKPEQDEMACDIRKVELALVSSNDSEGFILVRRITTNLLSPRSLEPTEEVLCRKVKSFNLRYSDGFNWLDDWDSTANNDTLPRAIEVSLEIGHQQAGTTTQSDGCKLTHAFVMPCSSPESETGQSAESVASLGNM